MNNIQFKSSNFGLRRESATVLELWSEGGNSELVPDIENRTRLPHGKH